MQKLSKREREVYNLWHKGLMIKQIAIDLNLSKKSISEYKRRAFKKLGLTRNGTRNKCGKFKMQTNEDDQTRETNVWHWF
jgi:DNA-binding NarL/FixJ family response regulator